MLVADDTMKRYDIINALISKYDYKSYLEIGVQKRVNFENVKNVATKIGVDPEPKEPVDFEMTSDEFFRINRNQFDIVFVDGLHHQDQVYKDIVNSLAILNENGTIVCHDCDPIEEVHQIVPRECGTWNGDVWKAWVRLRSERDDLEMNVIDTDYGCGVIRRGQQIPISIKRSELNWRNLQVHKEEWLSLITVDEFLRQVS